MTGGNNRIANDPPPLGNGERLRFCRLRRLESHADPEELTGGQRNRSDGNGLPIHRVIHAGLQGPEIEGVGARVQRRRSQKKDFGFYVGRLAGDCNLEFLAGAVIHIPRPEGGALKVLPGGKKIGHVRRRVPVPAAGLGRNQAVFSSRGEKQDFFRRIEGSRAAFQGKRDW